MSAGWKWAGSVLVVVLLVWGVERWVWTPAQLESLRISLENGDGSGRKELVRRLLGYGERGWEVVFRDLEHGTMARRKAVERLLVEAGDVGLGQIRRRFEHRDWRVRELLVRAVGKMRPRSVLKRKFLEQSFGDEHGVVKYEAVRALAGYGSEAWGSLDGWVKLLKKGRDEKSKSPKSKHDHGLKEERPTEKGLAQWQRSQKLQLCLSDEDPYWEVRLAVVEALPQVENRSRKAMFWMVQALQDRRERVREAASLQLLRGGQAAVDVLLPVLRHNEYGLREVSAQLLGKMGKKAWSTMLKILEHEEPAIWYAGLRAVMRNPPTEGRPLGGLCEMLLKAGPEKKRAMSKLFRVLGAMGVRHCLLKALVKGSVQNKLFGLRALGWVAASTKEALPHQEQLLKVLIGLLDWKDKAVVREALATLGWMGQRASGESMSLLRWIELHLKSLSGEQAGLAFGALSKIGVEKAVIKEAFTRFQHAGVFSGALVDFIRAYAVFGPSEGRATFWLGFLVMDDRRIGEIAMRVLGRRSDWLRGELVSLRAMMAFHRGRKRERLLRMLGRLGSEALVLLPEIVEATRGESFRVREAALLALGKMGALPQLGLSALREQVLSGDWRLQVASLWSLGRGGRRGKLGAQRSKIRLALIKVLGSRKWQVRREAVRTMVRILVPERKLILLLDGFRRDPSFGVQLAIRKGLELWAPGWGKTRVKIPRR